MKTRIAFGLALALLIGGVARAQQAAPTPTAAPAVALMTNADVIDMVGLGLSDDIIIDKIHSAPGTNFDTSLPGLKALKVAKVSDAVIRAMINPDAARMAVAQSAGANEAVAAAAAAASAPPPPPPPFHSVDGHVRIYVTDHPINEVIGMAQSESHVSADSSGVSGGSRAAGIKKTESGDDPRTVEVQADIQKNCPAYIMVSNNPSRADYILVFRREGGKRSTFFAMGGLTGLALSAASKVDGASIFNIEGDMIKATKQTTVAKCIIDICNSIPAPPGAVGAPAPPVAPPSAPSVTAH